MLSKKYISKHDNVTELNFIELVRYLELSSCTFESYSHVIFRSYLGISSMNKGIRKIKEDFVISRMGNSYNYRVYTTILALLGSKGVLPYHYTEKIIKQDKIGDTTLLDFLDIFYNKIVHAFYCIVRDSNISINFQQYVFSKGNQIPMLIKKIGSLIGVEYRPGSLHFNFLLRYAGILAMRMRTASSLKSMISSWIGENVEIQQFVTMKKSLTKNQLTSLGKKNSRLDGSFYSGLEAYLHQSKVIISCNTLSLKRYKLVMIQSMNKNSFLNKILKFYLGKSVVYNLDLSVSDKDKVTKLVCSNPVNLGITLWSKV